MRISTVIFTYAAAAHAFFSYATGTCTGNDASQLTLIVLSIPLYVLAAFSFSRVPKGRATYFTAFAILPAVLWQISLSTWLAFHLVFLNTSACGLLFGGPFPHDGNEVWYAVMWLLPLLSVPIAVVLRRR